MNDDEYFGNDLPICTVCLKQYKSEDGLSYICPECDRSGFCEFCVDTKNHNCNKE